MSPATSVLRRYTPPTCTLEIAANSSPLSRWIGQSALKNVRFKLSFDDPRVGEDQWVAVRGDRNQLQALCDAVTSYVQKFLHQSSSFIAGRDGFSNGAVAVPQSLPSFNRHPFDSEGNAAGIYLEPKGMLSHELHLGTLATDESGSTIQLSAVQLADLATALDEYSADVTAIPTLNRPSWASNPPAWGKIAAVSLVAIGLTTTAVRVLDRQPTPQTAASQGASSSDQRLAVQPLPSSPPPSSLTLPSLPTTTVPLPSLETSPLSAPPAPENLPRFKVEQTVPENSQSGIQLPVRDVPEGSVQVAPIPDQTASGAKSPQAVAKAPSNAGSASQDRDGDPLPLSPENNAASTPERAPEAASRPQLPSVAAASRQASAETAQPQVDELKTYFASRWQVPQGLPDDIQFILTLAADGSLQAVEPVGPNATSWRDRASIPALGEVIATPNPNGQETKVRLLLKTNGAVQTLAE
ncbi:DUF4335 domain-containing protein [Myxacorys almedinensis]|uniref:DUF4335 domain-containing protein n=1 Tax=Myxacorys almedinensis A TaxID=2690445 RepID=A0A8J7Z101_9CYAN|nr:DUF4335 domain-containing protein [Myxacorys almedinensis]NDJ18297.1 DUF4335 domain-containing protein [Myxacorys almedinensis A]